MQKYYFFLLFFLSIFQISSAEELSLQERRELQKIIEEIEILSDHMDEYRSMSRQLEGQAQPAFLSDWKDFSEDIKDSEKLENRADQIEEKIKKLQERLFYLQQKMDSSKK